MQAGTRESSWSKSLFGNKHMLRVATVIAQGRASFTAPDVEQSTGLGPSNVHRLIGTLCDIGLVSRVDRRGGERVQRYQRERRPFWTAITDISRRALGADGTPDSEGTTE